MYKNILIATDGSDFANRGVKHGLKLAKTVGCPVTIVIVTEQWSARELAQNPNLGGTNPLAAYEESVAKAATKILASVEVLAQEQEVRCKTIHIKDTHPAEGIISTADSEQCDLIVMASHGRRGVQKVLLGSIASEVMTHSNIPVLVVRS